MNKKVFLKTYGCQMNKLDSELVASALTKVEFTLVDDIDNCDVVLINTCSVRQKAEEKVISLLGNLKKLKKTKPDLIVGVIGCMAQRLGNKLLENKTVDIVCGPAQIPEIPELIRKVQSTKCKVQSTTKKIREKPSQKDTDAFEHFESSGLTTNYELRTKNLPAQAFVRVMHGCDNFCSYCVVPYVRGPEVSRPPAAIIEQIKKLADEGIKQVTLLGQAVNKYKYTSGEKIYCLADILKMASKIEAIEWIRFVTNYPYKEYFEDICRTMADIDKVCNYLHIPAQSGSDKILKKMNRNYTAKEYLTLIDTARKHVPDIAVSGDFIVGFPGETEQDFAATVDLVKKVRYKNCFIFKYSPRPGTKAEELEDNIPIEIKRKRNNELLATQEKISGELAKEFLGKTVKVLVEGPSKKPHLDSAKCAENPQLTSRTAGDWIVVFNGPQSLRGKFAEVKIAKTMPLTLFGTKEL